MLLFGLAIVLAAFSLFNVLQVNLHRASMQSMIEKNWKTLCCEEIQLNKAQHPEANKYREFDLNGHRYDVVSVMDCGTFWQVTAIDDTREKWLEEQAEKSGDTPDKNSNVTINLATEKGFNMLIPMARSTVILAVEDYYESIPFLPVISPPPEVLYKVV